jgi:hypothetical protein
MAEGEQGFTPQTQVPAKTEVLTPEEIHARTKAMYDRLRQYVQSRTDVKPFEQNKFGYSQTTHKLVDHKPVDPERPWIESNSVNLTQKHKLVNTGFLGLSKKPAPKPYEARLLREKVAMGDDQKAEYIRQQLIFQVEQNSQGAETVNLRGFQAGVVVNDMYAKNDSPGAENTQKNPIVEFLQQEAIFNEVMGILPPPQASQSQPVV